MDKQSRIINFRDADDAFAKDLEEIIAIYDENFDDWPPSLFSNLDRFKGDLKWEEAQLIFIDSSWHMVEGDGNRITVVTTRDPLSLAVLLENGFISPHDYRLPMLRNVEILLSGDIGPVRCAKQLSSIGIRLESNHSLLLDERWKRTGSGNTPHFRSGIWKNQDRQLLLETILNAERASFASYVRGEK